MKKKLKKSKSLQFAELWLKIAGVIIGGGVITIFMYCLFNNVLPTLIVAFFFITMWALKHTAEHTPGHDGGY